MSFLDFSFNNFIIAGSDVIITHCMSSPTAEALGAGKKAFWYESGHKHAGIDYDQVPGLVVHGYEALSRRVRELLEMPDDGYERYLQESIRGKIDSYLDGKALTRFKDLLSGVIV